MAPSAARWGTLLVAALSTSLPPGCAQPPPPVAPPLPAPAPPPEVPPAPKPPQLSSIQWLTEGTTEGTEGPSHEGRIQQESTQYGRGTLVLSTYERWSDAPPRCPLKLPGPCQTFTISSSGRSPDEAAWLDRAESPGETGTTHGPFPVPHAWIAFAAARDAVYALRRDGHTLDRIDDTGKVTPFAHDASPGKIQQIKLIEIGDRAFLLHQKTPDAPPGDETLELNIHEPPWFLAELLPDEASKGMKKLGPPTKMPMAPMPAHRPNAQGARTAVRSNGMAMYGTPRLTRVEGKDEWAMVWLEIIPPDYDWPAGKPQQAKGAAGPRKRGAKNGCGGPSSRRLNDRSVQKRAHVTRFSGASLVADQVAWSSSDLDPYGYRLEFRQENGDIKLQEPPKKNAKAGSSDQMGMFFDRSKELDIFPHEVPENAAFDPQSREGLAVLRVGESTQVRRFDAEGAWVGAPVKYTVGHPSRIRALTRHKGHWIALADGPEPLRNLTENKALSLGNIEDRGFYLYTSEGKLRLLTFRDDTLFEYTLDDTGKPEDKPLNLGAFPKGTYGYDVQVLHPAGSPPVLLVVSNSRGEENNLHWRTTTVGSPWKKINPFHGDAPDTYRLKVRQTHGDMVALYTKDKRTTATWLNAGKQERFDAPEEQEDDGGLRDLNLASYLSSAEGKAPSYLPGEPGAPVVVEGLGAVEKECNAAVPTAPGVVVFLCAQALDEKKPGYRAGLRILKMNP